MTTAAEFLATEINADVVKAAAFHELPDDVMALLTDDDHLIEFTTAIRDLNADLGTQLAVYIESRNSGMSGDIDWYRRTASLKHRVNVLDRRLAPMKQERQNRIATERREVVVRERQESFAARQVNLARAIRRHRGRVLEEFEATEADEELWSALQEGESA